MSVSLAGMDIANQRLLCCHNDDDEGEEIRNGMSMMTNDKQGQKETNKKNVKDQNKQEKKKNHKMENQSITSISSKLRNCTVTR